MASDKPPWYERSPVLAGTVVALAVVLGQPFVTDQWPTQLASFLQRPWVGFVISTLGGAAAAMVGYAIGRRRPAAATQRLAGNLDVLNEDERLVLNELWSAPQAFLPHSELAELRQAGGWAESRWNTVLHSLIERRGLVAAGRHSVGTGAPGWLGRPQPIVRAGLQLTVAGRQLMAGLPPQVDAAALRERIAAWRAAIEAADFSRPAHGGFGESAEYASLRPHLDPGFVRAFEGRTAFVGAEGRGPHGAKHVLLDAVARIEREWGLV